VADRPLESIPDQDDRALRKHVDPGGAHSKGYSAEPGPTLPVPDNDSLPLAKERDTRGHVRRGDEDAVVPPTGRETPATYSPDDRTIANG
jgi:hypothetical protein